ncbi:hypothetical protein HFC70_02280 [Agrobacterium sp. a22-2]|nr:hypothetical protein [Agrobacterium sp. a22-2]
MHALQTTRTAVSKKRAAGEENLERVVLDIARLIGRQMARVAANDNGNTRAGRDDPEAE